MIKTVKLFSLLCLMITLVGGCDIEDGASPSGGNSLILKAMVDLSGVPEPSGLALDTDGQHFWTVSDQTGDIYRVTFNGQVVSHLEFNGEDLEGIAVDPQDGTLFVVEERAGEVVHLSRSGHELQRWSPGGLPDMGNSGFEGITVDPLSGNFFILKEKDPGLLIKMNRNGAVLSIVELNFAGDYSGLTINTVTNELLILSDQSKNLSWCDTAGNVLRTFSTGLEKGEGVAFDLATDRLYLVSDSQGTLTTFEIPNQ